MVIWEDLNHREPEQLIQRYRDNLSVALRSQVGEITHSEGKFRIGDKVIAVMPMGLKDDSDLSSLGVTSHSMEDYLMKMLLLDESLRPLAGC